MRLWVFSDLHQVPGHPTLVGDWALPNADVCIAAGDICENSLVASMDLLFRKIASQGMPVVFVAGNHEFYGGNSLLEGVEAARDAALRFPGVHFLERDSVVLGGTRFLGITLWTDFALQAVTAKDIAWSMNACEAMMADYRESYWRKLPSPERLTAAHTLRKHERSRAWLERELARPHAGSIVVVTHHAPHPGSVAPRWRGNACTPAFVSDLSDLVQGSGADLWVHGHVHDFFDYDVGDTRVVCNPRGYGSERTGFVYDYIVEV